MSVGGYGIGIASFLNAAGLGTPPAPNEAPVNIAIPVVTGAGVVGTPLASDDGSWSGHPDPTFAYQWKRGTTNIGTNSATYVLVDLDTGHDITCTVTATNVAGSASATSAPFAVPASSAKRYWRMLATKAGSGAPNNGLVEINNFEFLDINGDVIPLIGTPSASSSNGASTPDRAFDGNLSTFWTSGATTGTAPQWLAWDFGSGADIDVHAVRIACNGSSRAPVDFAIEWSANYSDWTPAWSNYSQLYWGGTSEPRTYKMPVGPTDKKRRWRLLITATPNGGSFPEAGELEFVRADGTVAALNFQSISSSANGASIADNAFNGLKSGGFWTASGSVPQWIGYDFGVGEDIVEVRYTNGNDTGRALQDAEVQYDDMSDAWTTAWVITGQVGWTSWQTRSFKATDTLFANGEPGVFYDISDLSMLSQQNGYPSAVTVGSPVGMVRDKSRGTAFGPDFATPVGEFRVYNDGTDRVVSPDLALLEAGKTYLVIVPIIASVPGVGVSFQVAGSWNNMQSAGIGSAVGNVNRYVTALSSGALNIAPDNVGADCTISGVTVQEMPGRQAIQLTQAARPILRQNAEGYYYLEFDGIDDSLWSPQLDFGVTNKVTVWAGIKKYSDASVFMLAELTADKNVNNGSWSLFGPNLAGTPAYNWTSKGTQEGWVTASGFAAPITSVLTGIGDISGGITRLRVNGVQVASSGANQGTGNYQNAAVYMGRRGSISLPFNGEFNQLIIRGAETIPGLVGCIEDYVNGKTGAY